MTKTEKIKLVKKMNNALGVECEHKGGFNEWSQFQEEMLRDLLPYLSHEGLDLFMRKIESASSLGVTRDHIPDFLGENRL